MTSTDARTDPDCLFCRIVAGELPADVVATSERSVAFRDIDPQAPVHVLVVPRDHHGDIAQLAAADPELLSDVVALADEVAGDLADGQFRLIFNSGPRAGPERVPRARARDRRCRARVVPGLSPARKRVWAAAPLGTMEGICGARAAPAPPSDRRSAAAQAGS